MKYYVVHNGVIIADIPASEDADTSLAKGMKISLTRSGLKDDDNNIEEEGLFEVIDVVVAQEGYYRASRHVLVEKVTKRSQIDPRWGGVPYHDRSGHNTLWSLSVEDDT